MPRVSAEERSTLSLIKPDAIATRPRLSPPSSLTTAERLEFIAIAAENKHLRRTDAVMLASYVQAATRVAKLARSKQHGPWGRAVATMLALARSMRLTQQAQYDPKTVGRKNRRTDAVDAAAIMAQLNREAADDA